MSRLVHQLSDKLIMKVFIALVLVSACGGELMLMFDFWDVARWQKNIFTRIVLSTPVENVEPIDPMFDANRDVRILLQTRRNQQTPQQLIRNDLQSVQGSNFDRNKPTRVLVHGWWEDDTSDINVATAAELLDYNDFNVKIMKFLCSQFANFNFFRFC
jgi:hypothetical protein